MDSNKLEKMKQWETVITVMGFDLDSVMDSAWDSDDEFMSTLVEYRKLEQRKADQEPVLQAVLRTLEMNIDEDDIEEYHDYIEKLKAKKQEELDTIAINSSPLIQRLHTVHGFEFVDSPRRYRSHLCFKFKTADGTAISGRAFRPTWDIHRIWTSWKDKTGKSHKQKWEPKYSTYAPKDFPAPWANSRASTEVLCYMMAYYITTPKVKMPESHLVKVKK